MLEIQIGGIACKVSLLFPAVLLLLLLLDQGETAVFCFAAACLHESGHLLAMCLCGRKPKTLVFSFYGIRMDLYADTAMPFWQEIIIAVSGPLMNVCCGVVMLLVNADPLLAQLHLVLASLNLLPIFPLDGGRVVGAVCEMFFSSRTAERVQSFLFWCVWLALFTLGVLLIYRGESNITLIVLSFYILCLKVFQKGN